MSKQDMIVAFARTLVGTKFHHAARVPGVGIDCVGVVVLTGAHIGAWPSGFDVMPYTEVPKEMLMRSICRKYLHVKRYNDMTEGDVVLVTTDKVPQHIGIVGRYKNTHHKSIIHACNLIDNPRVVEHPLMFTQHFRYVEAYSFPGV